MTEEKLHPTPTNLPDQPAADSETVQRVPHPTNVLLNQIGRSTLLLPALPYRAADLSPWISAETVALHYEKHHRTYLKKVRLLIKTGPFDSDRSLEEIVLHSAHDGPSDLFNNAAQAWNHNFYWKSLSPKENAPAPFMASMINARFGSLDALKFAFISECSSLFGSGWGWLVLANGKLEIEMTANADTPFVRERIPLLAVDVWEHAYYLDYQNRRDEYLKNVIAKLLDWQFASDRLQQALRGIKARARG